MTKRKSPLLDFVEEMAKIEAEIDEMHDERRPTPFNNVPPSPDKLRSAGAQLLPGED